MDAHADGPPPTAALPAHALWPAENPRSVVLVMRPPITRCAIPGLCDQVSLLVLTRDVDVVTCDLSAITEPDAVAIDALTRMQVTAKHLGRSIRLRHPTSFLRVLLTLTGLADTLPVADDLGCSTDRRDTFRRSRGCPRGPQP